MATTTISTTIIPDPAKRAIRTAVQTGIPAFITFATVLPFIIDALGLPVDAPVRLWLLAVAAGITATATAISRVMAIPAVNGWLAKIGLASITVYAAVETHETPVEGE